METKCILKLKLLKDLALLSSIFLKELEKFEINIKIFSKKNKNLVVEKDDSAD